MFENIRYVITRLPMNRLIPNLAGHIPSCPRHVPYDLMAMATAVAWQRPLLGNGRCLATLHWTFCSYRRLETEHVNLFRWNLVHNSMLGPQWQLRDQILKFLKFKMAHGRHVGKYLKCHNSPTNGPTGMQLGWLHPIMFSTCPPCCG